MRHTAIRKIGLVLLIVAGAFWVVSPLVLDYPAKTQAVDKLTNTFRPAFTDAALAQSAADLRTSATFANDFRTKAAPAFAQQLHITPEQFITAVAKQYPAVGAGLVTLPQSLAYFNSVQQTMAAQQQNFHQADAIPTKNLPNTTVPWLFILPGLIAIALGVFGLAFWRGAVAPALAAALGACVIATTLVISTPPKTRAVDRLTDALRPVFTTQSATQARGYVTTLQAMDAQLTQQVLPGLASQLHTSPQQLSTNLAEHFPTVATGLQQMPAILGRIDALVTGVSHNLHDFQLADAIPSKDLPTTDVEWQFVIPAALLIAAGGAAAVSGLGRRRFPLADAPTPAPALAEVQHVA